MPSSNVRRSATLALRGHLQLSLDSNETPDKYKVTICDLTSRGALVMVDLPGNARLRLFENINFCRLEFHDVHHIPEAIDAKSVWLEPQTSAGDFMTFKIGLAFENVSPELGGRLAAFAAEARQKDSSLWFNG